MGRTPERKRRGGHSSCRRHHWFRHRREHRYFAGPLNTAMRHYLLICVTLLASAAVVLARDIVTLTGQTYYNVTVTRVDKTGILITHRDGTAFLEFSALPPAFRA